MAGIAAALEEVTQLLLVAHPKLATGIGTNEINRQSSPPRVVWIIPSAGHTPAQKIGRPKSVLTRDVAVIAHVWGADLAELEGLIDDTIGALHRVMHGSIVFGGEDWLPTDESNLGMAALLRFTLSAPVIERRFKAADHEADTRMTKATVTAIDADISGSAQGDGNIDWKEP